MVFKNYIGLKKFHEITIGQKIIIICLMLAIVPTLIVGIVAYLSASQAIYDNVQISLETQVNDIRDSTASTYQLTKSNLNILMSILKNEFYARGNPSIIDGKMVMKSDSNQYIINNNYEIVDNIQKISGNPATIFQKQGDKAIRISTNILSEDGKRAIGTELNQKIYDEVINKGQTYYGPATILGKKYVAMYEPIKDDKGDTIGVLFTGQDEQKTLGIIKDQIKAKKIGEKGYVVVMNLTGTTIIHPTKEGESLAQYPFIQEMISKKNGFIEYDWEGQRKVAGFTYYEPLDWLIIATSYTNEFLGPLDVIRNSIILVVILTIIAGTIVSLLFGRSISRRMNELVISANRIIQGDLSIKNVIPTNHDEIGILAKAFNEVLNTMEGFRDEIQTISHGATSGKLEFRGDPQKFKGDFSNIISGINHILEVIINPLNEVKRLSNEYANGNFSVRVNPDFSFSGDFITFKEGLNKIGIEISNTIEKINDQMMEMIKGVDLIDSNVNSVSSGLVLTSQNLDDVSNGSNQVSQIASTVKILTEESKDNTNQILTALQDLSTTVTSVAAKTEEVSILTNNASTLSFEGKSKAVLAENGMQEILHSSSEIEKMITDIHVQMREIGRIVDIIGEIAEQTNLLALNAAIEAARAGEAGLGFAVVAGEVKELAGNSQKSAENIGEIIRTLQKMTDAIQDKIKISLTEVKSGGTAVGETLEIFNQLVESISNINQNMNEVAAASEEQSASVEEVTASVHEYSQMILETAKESTKLEETSKKSFNSIQEVFSMFQEVNESMNEIQVIVNNSKNSVNNVNDELSKFKVK